MKKLYLLLIAALISLSAGAVDYYLIGGFNGWTLKDPTSKFTAQGDGTYVLDYNGTLTPGFKINDGTWSNNNDNFGGGGLLTIGQTYNLTVGGSSGNINMAGNIENPHIVFNPTAKTLLITGQSVAATYKYGIHGNFTDPNWSTTDMTEANGKWKVEGITCSATATFGIKKMDASTGAQTDWISANGTSNITAAGDYPCKVEGTNFTIPAGTYDFTYDPETMKLTVAGEFGGEIVPPVVDYTKWYVNVIGDFNDWADNGIQPTADGLTKHTNLAIGKSGFKVKVWNGTADVYYSNGQGLPTGEWVTIDGNAGPNMTIKNAGTDCVYDVEFDVANSKIKVTLVSGTEVTDPVDPDPYTGWYVNVLGVYNDWADNGVNPDAEGLAKLTDLAIGRKSFKVKVWNGADNWYCNGQALATGEWIKLSGDDGDMTVLNAGEDCVYDVEYNVVSNEIKLTLVSGTEITPVEPTTYTVYFDNSTANWENVNCYVWNDGSDGLVAWPGEAMTEGENDIWSYTFEAAKTPDLVIFNNAIKNGDEVVGKDQTDNLVFEDGKTYTYTPEVTITVNYENTTSAWPVVYCYAFNAAGTVGAEYPGQIMEVAEPAAEGPLYAASNTWTVTFTAANTPTGVVFNNGQEGDENKTKDFTYEEGKTYSYEAPVSGLENITVDADANAEYYNLQGVRVANPTHGLYIRRAGNSTIKVVL